MCSASGGSSFESLLTITSQNPKGACYNGPRCPSWWFCWKHLPLLFCLLEKRNSAPVVTLNAHVPQVHRAQEGQSFPPGTYPFWIHRCFEAQHEHVHHQVILNSHRAIQQKTGEQSWYLHLGSAVIVIAVCDRPRWVIILVTHLDLWIIYRSLLEVIMPHKFMVLTEGWQNLDFSTQ